MTDDRVFSKSEKHKPSEINLTAKGWTGTCLCGDPVKYTGTVRDGEWRHVDGR